MSAKICRNCGRFHNPRQGCGNHVPEDVDDRSNDDPRTGYPTMIRHGHTIRDGQPRVRHQISRQMRDKCR